MTELPYAWHGRFEHGQHRALFALVFVTPPLIGDIGTALILLVAITYLPHLCSARFRAERTRTMLIPGFAGVFVAMGIAFALSARDISDALLVFNFSALLLALPVMMALANLRAENPFVLMAGFALSGSLCAALVGVIGHHILGIARVGWHVVNPIHFGNISVFLGFLSLAGLFATNKPWRWVFLAGPVLGVIGTLYSGSRGPILTAATLGALSLIFAVIHFRHSRSLILIGIAAAMAIAAIGVGLAQSLGIGQIDRMAGQLAQLLTSGETTDRSTQLRLAMYEAGVQAFLAAPFFGHGWGNLIAAVQPYLSSDDWHIVSGFTHLHNDPIDFAVGAGTVGIIAYATMIVLPVLSSLTRGGDRHFAPRLFAALTLSIGFLVSGMTNLLLGNGLQTTLFAFMAACIVGLGRAHQNGDCRGSFASANAGDGT